jgi:AcrR family transcriptional regulator
MDTVATRAETSKRSLYAHFESKDKLFVAVMDLIRDLYLDKLKTPDAYADDPVEAVTRFCGRFLQLMTWETQIRTSRLNIAEAERLPGNSSAYYDGMFATTHERLAAYVKARYPTADAPALAEDLLSRTVLPRLFRVLLNVEDPLKDMPTEESLLADVDLNAIRQVVSTALPA